MRIRWIRRSRRTLKVSWVKKLITQPKSQWCKLLNATYKDINKILIFGGQYCDIISKNIQNQFWRECIDGLESPEQNAKIEGNPEILRNCIWYNPRYL